MNCRLPIAIFDAAPLASSPLQYVEEYHASIGRSVTDFMVVRRQKGSLFLCTAGGRSWPLATDIALQPNVRF
jgi:hypothetical protein